FFIRSIFARCKPLIAFFIWLPFPHNNKYSRDEDIAPSENFYSVLTLVLLQQEMPVSLIEERIFKNAGTFHV
ncbi:MAG TPA: hypothetical protein VEP90_07175, partial [Methylomirabilota bacterium]|nr:hypothetical protein [Methylomirabilota bacterium]